MVAQEDMFYANEGKYIQLMVKVKDTGSIWSYFHMYSELEKALEHYNKLAQDKDLDVIWLEGRKLDPNEYYE